MMCDMAPHAPLFLKRIQQLYDRYDLLCDACHNIRWAAEALRACRDSDQAQNLAALEDIGVRCT